MSDIIDAYSDLGRDDDPDTRRIRACERRLEQVLAAAGFVTGCGEPLLDVARSLVALLDGRDGPAHIVRTLQAWAAPASSYVPPPEQFADLAPQIVAAYESVGAQPDPSV